MSIERPCILTRFTVPTGGWTLDFSLSVTTSLDTALQAVVPAGDYYMAWDNQTDDFLRVLLDVINDAAAASAVGARVATAWIDSDHKVHILFPTAYHFSTGTDRDVEFDWTTNNGPSIAGVLGFDASAADSITSTDNPHFTADYHHAYGWYAEEDGRLRNHWIEDSPEPVVEQTRGPAQRVKTQRIGMLYENVLDLQMVPRTDVFSSGVSYTEASVYPYARNKPLQCWFNEASKGTPFRVYRQGRVDFASIFGASGTPTGGTSTLMTDSGASFATDPQRWKGRMLYVDSYNDPTVGDFSDPMRWYIASHTATAITVANKAALEATIDQMTPTYYLVDQTYREYVLDTKRMAKFLPTEMPGTDKFDISIPLWRFVS